MKKAAFRKTPIATAISLALSATPAVAQQGQSADNAIEEVVVRGIRQSLRESMDVKRNRDGIVDAITSEDIGDFPDTNLAESLQRITGVSIDRQRGEGSRVTVRGFGPSFNLVLLNGRQMPTSSTAADHRVGRSFDFGNLASENIAAVEVYKSGQANVASGGIGSTLNIRTTRPLDAPGLTAAVSGSVINDHSTERGDDLTPEISGIFTNTFADNTFGIAVSASYQERDNGVDTASVGGWRSFTGDTNDWGTLPRNADQQNRPAGNEVYSVPQSIGYEFAEFSQTRLNGQLTLQWRPIDSIELTLDHTLSEFELDRQYSNFSAWFNFGGQQTAFTDADPVASPVNYTELTSGSDFSMGGGIDATKNTLNSTGLNLVWDISNSWSIEFDHHESTSESEPNSRWGDSALVSTASFTRDSTTLHVAPGRLPVLELGLSSQLNPDDMRVTGSVFQNNFSNMDIAQSRVEASYEFDAAFVESIDFGVQMTEVDYRSAGSVVQRDAWNADQTEQGAISDLLDPATLGNAFDEIPGGNDIRLQNNYYRWNMAQVVERMEALIASGDAELWPVADLGACGTGFCPTDNLQYDRRTTEESQALYAQLNTGGNLWDRPYSIRFGLRYEETDVDSRALAPNYVRIDWTGGNEFAAIAGGGTNFTQLTGNYDAILPNIDFQMDVTEDMVVRASISKTLTRPNFNDIQGGLTINNPIRVNGGTGNRGNPALEPFDSTNLDLSWEWYYGEDSYFAVGYFNKDVENFIGITSVEEPSFNLPHPGFGGGLYNRALAAAMENGTSTETGALYQWILDNLQDEPGVEGNTITGVAGRDPIASFDLTIPVAIEEASVDGWELVVQHNFGNTGFGLIANATIVEADVGYDNTNLTEQFVISGLSDSANLIGFYEKAGVNVRLTWNWRDAFLAGTGQANVGAAPPTYVDEYEQWDISVGYDFNFGLELYFVGINITDETTYVYGRDRAQALFASQLGPRYQLGVRYKF